MLTGFSAIAQTPPQALQYTTVNLNYVYAASLGFGGYRLGGLAADVYTLPLFDTFHNFPQDGWSLKVLLPIQLGLYNFNSTFQGTRIEFSQQSVAAVPGVELQIPVTDRFAIKPFGQAGPAYAFGSGVGDSGSWIYLAGARSVAQWRSGAYTLFLGNGIVYAGDSAMGPGFNERYVSLQIAGEVRRPLGFEIWGVRPDVGVYAADYYYPAPLKFERYLEPPLHVHNQNEIGFSLGSAEPLKVLWLSNPRVGAGFVFGGGLQVWHINFGFPF